MKNLISLTGAALMIFFASTALGEESVGGFGIHGGATFNDFDYTNNTVNNAKANKTGYLAGIHLEGISAGFAGVRFEANYLRYGYDIANVATVNYNYLQIPILFKIEPIAGPIGVFVEAGPAAALHLSNSITSESTTITFNDSTNTWNFSLIAGAGVAFKLDKLLIELEGRYDYGLTNISNSSSVEIKTRTIDAIAGLTFLM